MLVHQSIKVIILCLYEFWFCWVFKLNATCLFNYRLQHLLLGSVRSFAVVLDIILLPCSYPSVDFDVGEYLEQVLVLVLGN
jgi:hypothetical protein